MDRQERKQIKKDAFVEGTLSFVERFERNPRPYLLGAAAVLLAFFGGLATISIVNARAENHAQRLARGQAALSAPVVLTEPARPDDRFAGKTLVMHVRECGAREIKVPFHIGEDHSRTWVLTRTDTGLRLKHDHRHEDGSDDAVTMYGGDTSTPGSDTRQEFPVDADSIEMFEREGLTASVSNTWAMEIEPGERFLYELARPGGRLFRVEFDLAKPVATPPPPWGHPELP